MLNSIKIAALSAFLGLGALAAVPATAQAANVQIGISTHNLNVGYGHGWNRVCTPGKAVAKARRLGVRHARVRSIGHRTIRVTGTRYGHRVNLTFSKARNCPVVRW
ncbi:hypothetical protein [Aquamicrobium soli]|jgi:ABC-type sugar transport system substrate-binding protein|uniref:Antifreeze protein n=1 Tax=Aquamicrobium soli TaxID=1811518 RepID=A0ABV7KGE1_9HYPH